MGVKKSCQNTTEILSKYAEKRNLTSTKQHNNQSARNNS